MQGKTNWTRLPLWEPTITLKPGWAPVHSGWAIEAATQRLVIDLDESSLDGTEAIKAPGDLLKLGDPERVYEIDEIVGDLWKLHPGIEPHVPAGQSADDILPLPCTNIKIKIISDIDQYRGPFARGPWTDIQWEEYIGA